MASSPGALRHERAGSVLTLTLDRPPLNVLDIPMIEALAAALESAAADRDLAVVHVRAAGSKGFSAGVDVADHTPERIGPMLEAFHRAFRILGRMDPVSVAEVFGACLGGGCELAVMCDFTIAAEDAKIGQPEIELACFPPVAAAAFGGIVGSKRALRACHPGAFDKSLGEAERIYLEELVRTEDMAEGMAAFMERRAPVWRQR